MLGTKEKKRVEVQKETIILDGKKVSEEILEESKKEVDDLKAKGIFPGLAAFLLGNNPASEKYVGMKKEACERVGIRSFPEDDYPKDMSEEELLKIVNRYATNKNVDGILVQLPLPDYINKRTIFKAIPLYKDVDCFRSENFGKLILEKRRFVPCTPLGVIELLKRYNIEIKGTNAVVVGYSDIVGKPMAGMLLQERATVTSCHSDTTDLADHTKRADILVVAIGKPNYITDDMVKPGAVVIDVGINEVYGKIVGDVDFESVKEVAGAITPVPGGVGPMTISMLMKNVIEAAKMRLENQS